ncbi:hypothetical protein Anas_03431 [Armadillidium nasatum]|uniref:Uncharacterized protein n=1 Tax=Armadillidium nasatum TaxID=96803 RepID=A0A5N5TK66_9CRUS|nr:hypothetical protein Anas_03431 [Armadillidium nasatum]
MSHNLSLGILAFMAVINLFLSGNKNITEKSKLPSHISILLPWLENQHSVCHFLFSPTLYHQNHQSPFYNILCLCYLKISNLEIASSDWFLLLRLYYPKHCKSIYNLTPMINYVYSFHFQSFIEARVLNLPKKINSLKVYGSKHINIGLCLIYYRVQVSLKPLIGKLGSLQTHSPIPKLIKQLPNEIF